MSFSELTPLVQALSRLEKFRLMQALAGDLAHEEGLLLVEPNTPFPIWSPYETGEAATVKVLREVQDAEEEQAAEIAHT